MAKTYSAVTEGKCSAAEEYQVPRATLHDRVSGKVQFGACSGPPKYLTNDEESELADFLRNCARIGDARTRLQVLAIVQQVVREKGLQGKVTNDWWETSKHRHQDIKQSPCHMSGWCVVHQMY